MPKSKHKNGVLSVVDTR